jgi:hypothetical protein
MALFLGSPQAKADLGGILKRLKIGPDVSTYLPSSAATRARFGDSWFSVGIGIGTMDDPNPHGKLGPDFDIFYRTTGNGHAFILPVGVAYERGFARSGALMPYWGAGAYAVVADLRADNANIHSGFRNAWAGSLYLGVHYGKHVLAEARYYAFTKVQSVDLSGLSLRAGYRF